MEIFFAHHPCGAVFQRHVEDAASFSFESMLLHYGAGPLERHAKLIEQGPARGPRYEKASHPIGYWALANQRKMGRM
jgi:hypothetical protein